MYLLRSFCVLLLLFTLSILPSSAGDYHHGDNMVCADCHIMHYSQSHNYAGETNPQLSGGPYPKLLKEHANDLCLGCHDGKSDVPDVLGDNSGPAPVRQAGALNSDSGTLSYQTWMGHTLGSTDTAPGGTWSNPDGLSCVDCHDPHGGTNGGKDVAGNDVSSTWRNLRVLTTGGIAVSYVVGTNSLTKDIFEGSATGTNHYDVTNVFLNEPNTGKSGMAEFCKQCHGDFHGDIGDVNTIGGVGAGTSAIGLLRHPSAGVNIGGTGDLIHSLLSVYLLQSRVNFVKVMAADGKWGREASQGTPTCSTCHMAHGNRNPFSLLYLAGVGGLTEQGDSGTSMADTCRQCHA